jgi:membrane protein DedA with SNARE-associated domain
VETILIKSLSTYSEAICFLGAFLGGTGFVIFLAALAGQNVISPLTLLGYAFLGNFLSDLIWFFLGRVVLFNKASSMKILVEAKNQTAAFMARMGSREYLVFILIKFVYGIRIAAILYFGSIHYQWSKFFKHNALAVLIINLVALGVGWSAGKGLTIFVSIFENFMLATAILLGIAAVLTLVRAVVTKGLLKRNC